MGCAQVLVFDSDSRKFAYMPRGPVTDPDDACVLSRLVDAVATVCAREGVQFVRTEPQWAFQAQHVRRLESLGFTPSKQFIMPPRTVLVDLGQSLDTIWSGFRSNTRNRVRLAGPNIAWANWSRSPRRSPNVVPSSIIRPSSWKNSVW